MNTDKTKLKNEKIRDHEFLKEMYEDEYFPDFLVDKGRDILVDLCFQIEQSQVSSLEELYKLTHAATEKFNELESEFEDNDSEIETAAREYIAMDFEFISHSYGFTEADVEELILPRNW
jgi:hypothetical protein